MTGRTDKVLALDLATVTGWAYGRPGKVPTFGNVRFTKYDAPRAATYRAFRTWLDETWNVRDAQPDLIVYESPGVPMLFAGKTRIETIRTLIGLAEHLEEWAHDKVELREASVSQVRSHFIGGNYKAKVARPMVVDTCHDKGWMVETEDEGDACALWNYQCCFLDPEEAIRTSPLFQRRSHT